MGSAHLTLDRSSYRRNPGRRVPFARDRPSVTLLRIFDVSKQSAMRTVQSTRVKLSS